MSTFEQLLRKAPESNKAVSVPGGPTLTFKQFISIIDTLKASLAGLGLEHQDAVSISLPNSLEFASVFLAVNGSSYISAPLNPNYKQDEFEFYIGDLKSKLIIVPKGSTKDNYAAVLAARKFNTAVAEVNWTGSHVEFNLVEPASLKLSDREPLSSNPDDIAFVLHTSGTTGRPKAVPLLHRNMVATTFNIIITYHLSQRDVSYLVMPLFHVHGLLAGFLAPLGVGGHVVIPPKFSASSFWKDFADYGATFYTAVPTIHQILLRSEIPNPVPKIRFIRSCSSPLASATFKQLEETFKAPVLEAYAMTEACHQMTSNSLPPGKRKPGTVGVGQGVEIVILNDKNELLEPGKEGEVSIRGPNVTPGYINNQKANDESFTAGYFRTGDQGKFDEDGMLVLTGRIKELINRGGEKISPIELDDVLSSHPGVSEAVSYGVPDEMYGQQVNAAIVLKKDAKVSEEDLREYVASKVAKFKVPARFVFTDVMPKTATGKIQRRLIAEKFSKDAKL